VVHTTKAFENFIDGIQLYAIHPIKAQAGSRYDLGTAAFQIVGPEYITEGNLNNDSVAIHLTFGDTAFLFVGDAEADEEVGLRTYALKSDVLKVGHHGSTTSTSSAFLSAVSPSAAVISCGKGNEYGHPAQATLDRLRSRDINIYRTDLSGTIVATSDGEQVTFNTDPSNHGPAGQAGKSSSTSAPAAAAGAAGAAKSSGKSSGGTSSPAPAKSTAPAPAAPAPAASKEPEPAATPTTAPYIGNSNTMKFHRANCSSVKQMKESNKVPIFNRDDAINQGYVPCKRCTP
jgi:competence protein ComEC